MGDASDMPLLSLEHSMYPLEESRSLLDLYSVALHGKVERGTLLYAVALHHCAAFVFRDFKEASLRQWEAMEGDAHAEQHRHHMLRRFVAALSDPVYRDLLGYTVQ